MGRKTWSHSLRDDAHGISSVMANSFFAEDRRYPGRVREGWGRCSVRMNIEQLGLMKVDLSADKVSGGTSQR